MTRLIPTALLALGLAAVATLAPHPAPAQPVCTLDTATRDEMRTKFNRWEASLISIFVEHHDCFRWPSFFVAAHSLFQEGRRDEGLGWFYVAQIRARVTEAFAADEERGPRAFAGLMRELGPVMDGHGEANPSAWRDAVDWALAWDTEHPLDPASLTAPSYRAVDPESFRERYDAVREGLRGFRASLNALP